MIGTTPQGVRDPVEAAHWVRAMFARVAHRYDLANRLLSLGIDRWWRARTVDHARDLLSKPGSRTLDLCCGTGDLTFALARATRGTVMGADFCEPMLNLAVQKQKNRGSQPVFFEADALRVPLPDRSVDLITCAFGFRNLADYDGALQEFRRLLRPGGRIALLEFSHPTNPLLSRAYHLYSRTVLPFVGGKLSGAPDAYRYLPKSVKKFPDAAELARKMETAHFTRVRFTRMTGGIVALHSGAV